MGRSWLLFLIVILQVFHASLCVHGKVPESISFIRCKKHEQEALLKFKQSFTDDPMNRLSSWVGQDCCQWRGVSCDNVSHNVVKLNLRSKPILYYDDGLLGYYHSSVAACLPDRQVSIVSPGISSALLELKLLTHLDLSGNDFSGSRIPEFIGSMTQLRYLNLSSAGFSGPLPPQLGNLTNLVHLDLNVNYNCHIQYIYGKGLGWASRLSKLQSLGMRRWDLSRAHDTFKVLNTLPALSALSLFGCNLDNSHLTKSLLLNSSTTYFPTLQHLDLGANGFESPLPSVLKNMVSLVSLSLYGNIFNGSVPRWLRTIRRLEVLDLSYNGFNYVEGGIMGIMGNPCSFKHLDLSDNNITQGDIQDSFMSLSGCGAFELQYLDLSYNKMDGSLPSSLLDQLTNLSYLDLSRNEFKEFKGSASYVKLSALKYLDLSDNQLSGLIPNFIGHLTEIEYLDISLNTLQGTISGIGNLSKLLSLDMNFNSLNLDLDSSFNWRPTFQLRSFNVHSCVLNTVFPQWLRNQTQIEYLDLSNTGISGELPGWLWNSSNLRHLHLSGNRLSGSLPRHRACDESYFRICNLGWIDLHNNLLTGTIPKWLRDLGNVEVLDLSSNLLTGEISDGNNASSLISFGQPLCVLDLSDNMLSGEIQFGKVDSYTALEILSLRENQFSGPIPTYICDLVLLMVLELADNRLTGHIPRCLGSMRFHDDYGNSDTRLQIKEIVKGIVELSTGAKGGQSIIDLSSNYLVGTIPEELTNISALFALNLSSNHLTGHIPDKIGNLEELESLDLSNNNLSGTIPQSLSSIPWLSKLDLSNNHLHGPIPTGRQLQTLDDPSIYANNSGLCGFPLPNDCTKHDSPPSSTKVNPTAGKEDKYDKLWFILAVMSGVATGFWGVVGTLVINRSWRHAYFRYVEDVADRIYVPIKVRVNKFKRRFIENS
ncbi:hypothetical protein KSS87_018118 [Heliosperma pusillum]|nr:hypothetical protein KSS87_018118 [Heliosperma pusillum]